MIAPGFAGWVLRIGAWFAIRAHAAANAIAA
jgi:hypothetical protein